MDSYRVMSLSGAAMTPPATTNLYKHHRFPGESISHAVWLYFQTGRCGSRAGTRVGSRMVKLFKTAFHLYLLYLLLKILHCILYQFLI